MFRWRVGNEGIEQQIENQFMFVGGSTDLEGPAIDNTRRVQLNFSSVYKILCHDSSSKSMTSVALSLLFFRAHARAKARTFLHFYVKDQAKSLKRQTTQGRGDMSET